MATCRLKNHQTLLFHSVELKNQDTCVVFSAGFISCNQYGDEDVQDEFAGAIPNEPFSKIDSIRFARSCILHTDVP
ncbi:MAG: hypothetical protein GX115_05005 [Ruminiclostridium sp.]|nr:hypothetical protein [Ruminiclostridium sp.]